MLCTCSFLVVLTSIIVSHSINISIELENMDEDDGVGNNGRAQQDIKGSSTNVYKPIELELKPKTKN